MSVCNMSRMQKRVTSAEHRHLNSTLNKTTLLHASRQIRSASIVSSAVVEDGLSCKSIVNLKNNSAPNKDKADKITPPTTLHNGAMTSPRASRLMLGSGKLRRTDDTESVELHLDNEEYINLVNSKYENTTMFDMKRSNELAVGTSLGKRDSPISLSKTYVTRSGPLFLYSDNKVVADHKKEHADGNHDNGIQVQGHRVSPRQTYSLWAKHLQQKKTNTAPDVRSNAVYTKKEQKGYIGLGNRAGIKNPYSWNYSVLPLKLFKMNKTDTGRQMKTLTHLSSAVLDYQGVLPTVNEKYLASIRHTRHRTSGKCSEEKSRQLQRLTKWTNKWIAAQDFLLFEEYRSVVNRHRLSTPANEDGYRFNNREKLQITLPQHRPTNTPISSTYCHLKALSDEKQHDTLN